MPKKTSLTLAAIAVGAVVAGCGGSGSTAPGVALAPSSGATQGSITTAASTSTTTTSATVPTPTSGPLSKEPSVPVGKGALPTKLVTKDLITGSGATAQAGSTITVNYVGALYKNGKVFDASWKRNQTFTTQLSTGAVIPGWVQGIQGMKVGGRRVLIIPPSLAYKSAAQPGIPANSTLVFVVDLLKVG